ncbi:hypothetical protein AB0K52_21905 [Glycomyces sp. NPDC049804]|uniref:hypothetical protein n=1 Tax=Glycomyces sp. NPDC049804 TaxID=3154363 RepID=UPI0034468A1E
MFELAPGDLGAAGAGNSIKRLVHGTSNRPPATANRLTPAQRADLIHESHTSGFSQQDLAEKFNVSLGTVKRILRSHTTEA